ncbi:hypothetical protein [Corallococcus exercitus]|uniref:hypothetical protein n=1 Tax=Corallococcus exercitus TaxID=2316736 RepID=UPI0035D437DA
MSTTRPFARGASALDLAANSNAEACAVAAWEPDIIRCSKSAARLRGLAATHPLVEDAAQDARIKVTLMARRGVSGEHYVRSAISNSVQNSARQTLVAANEVPPEGIDHLAEEARDRDLFAEAQVRAWIARQPEQLRVVYDLLYREEVSQREAAERLGVSQPRVAKLHGELIARGRDELRALAA